ncbi:helix-turn-helix domain-containing protein [Calothrix sp. FACHB-1219]|uniref:helix-turn-helix domain-containing protein n=1 Tax=Calothrix sp. FACHB-1219 TaxID=2692778 RepID=UPI001688D387|nr:helix-turn-helix domain-containing protein [Calothrix sp. FACHB-1219]MBD2222789.1 helix-turn-helix domain-containing protein [Calothrix sp. FACHB-1219]
MTTFAKQLTHEIGRVARKQIKSEVDPLKKTVGSYRSEIAALKRQIRALGAQVRALSRGTKQLAKSVPQAAPKAAARRRFKFSSDAFLQQRKKLGLTQGQMAQLLGTSNLSVYKWESGQVTPRVAQQQKIASLRGLGKRAAQERLAQSI